MLSKPGFGVYGLSSLVFLLDQAAKFWFERDYTVRVIIPGFLGIRPLYNPNLVFGLWRIPWLGLLSLLISVIVITLTWRIWRRQISVTGSFPGGGIALGLLWGGIAGNLVDRLLLGQVFDFIQLWKIPVFNLADTALTAGAVIFLSGLLFSRPGSRPARPEVNHVP